MRLSSRRHHGNDNVYEKYGEDQSDRRPEQVPVEIGAEEVLCLAAVGLADNQEHRRRECRFELHETVHVDDGHGIEDDIHCRPDPVSHLVRHEREDEANGIDVEKQLNGRERIGLGSLHVGHLNHATGIAHEEHEDKEVEVDTQGDNTLRKHAKQPVAQLSKRILTRLEHAEDCVGHHALDAFATLQTGAYFGAADVVEWSVDNPYPWRKRRHIDRRA